MRLCLPDSKYYSHCLCFTGYAEFVNATMQAYESESSVEVCIRAKGYGFAVNVSTEELAAAGVYAIAS